MKIDQKEHWRNNEQLVSTQDTLTAFKILRVSL